ncbi:MAG: hypothetical protein ABWX92_04425 [Mycetocola sp.]
MRKVTDITYGSIGFVERGDRLHFHAEDDHREDWDGPRDFDITVRGTNLTSRHGPRIYSVEKIGPDLEDDFYLADDWTITVIPETTDGLTEASPEPHPAHTGHEYGGAYARAAALAAGDPDWMNATGGTTEPL